MIKRLRTELGFSSAKAFAEAKSLSVARYQLIERMLLLATPEEFELLKGESYTAYLREFKCGVTLMSTHKMRSFAAICGS